MMNIKQVAAIAKKHDVTLGKLKKTDLIRTIQLQEGNFDCFGKATTGECDQLNCCWRSDCLVPRKQLNH
nr:hypothetical protein [uncultured Glaciecola sp.]